MKKFLVIITISLLTTMSLFSQNLFFIGEESFPCTKTFAFKPNTEYGHDLNVLFAKDGKKGLLAVSKQTVFEIFISGKLIIYLDDGNVITCNDRVKYDYVDNTAISVFNLTDEQVRKMKTSTINTIRFELKEGSSPAEAGSFTASNQGTPTQAVVTDFFSEE